jgi:hypothetical protein
LKNSSKNKEKMIKLLYPHLKEIFSEITISKLISTEILYILGNKFKEDEI